MGNNIFQLTVNRWQFVRNKDGWKVFERVVRPITSSDSGAMLANAIEDIK